MAIDIKGNMNFSMEFFNVKLFAESECGQIFPESFSPKKPLIVEEKCHNPSHSFRLLGFWTLVTGL